MPRRVFDAGYYRRFYFDPRTRAATPEQMRLRANTIAALVKQLEIDVERIFDAGCGLGWMRAPLLRAFPGATYTGLETSEYLCQRYGWVHGSVATHRTRSRFDLVICNDVLQYLSDREASRAIANLAQWCRGALYLHVPTAEDWRENADHECSDGDVHLRPTEWYRKRVRRYFQHAGFGVYVRRGVPLLQWELEKA
ncbi:MAG TPA: class I SAM-dependent methyltransferase [Steroidobacter sp.]